MGWTPDRALPAGSLPRTSNFLQSQCSPSLATPAAETYNSSPRSSLQVGHNGERAWPSPAPIPRSASVPPRRTQKEGGVGPRAIAPHSRPVRELTGKITELVRVSAHSSSSPRRSKPLAEKVTNAPAPLRRSSSAPRQYAGMPTYDLDVISANAYHSLGVDDEGYRRNENQSHARRVAHAMSAIDFTMAGVQEYHDSVCASCMKKSPALKGACGLTSAQIGALTGGEVIGNRISVQGESLAIPSFGEVVFHERPQHQSPRETYRGAFGDTSEEVTLKKQRERWTSRPNQRGLGPRPSSVEAVVFGGPRASTRNMTAAEYELELRKAEAAQSEASAEHCAW